MLFSIVGLAGALATQGAGDASFSRILVSNQVQCKTPYTMTVGIAQGGKAVVATIMQGTQTLVEKKLPLFTTGDASLFDSDSSGCEEALINLENDQERMGLLVTFPGGKPAIFELPRAPLSASKPKRMGSKVRVYAEKKGKLCIADFEVKNDRPAKVFESCY